MPKVNNKAFQTLPDRRGKVKQCNPEKSFPCGKACLSIKSDILGRCQKNLITTSQNQALKLLFNLKQLNSNKSKENKQLVSKKGNQSGTVLSKEERLISDPVAIKQKLKDWTNFIDQELGQDFNDLPFSDISLTHNKLTTLNGKINSLNSMPDVLTNKDIGYKMLFSPKQQDIFYKKLVKDFNIQSTVVEEQIDNKGNKVLIFETKANDIKTLYRLELDKNNRGIIDKYKSTISIDEAKEKFNMMLASELFHKNQASVSKQYLLSALNQDKQELLDDLKAKVWNDKILKKLKLDIAKEDDFEQINKLHDSTRLIEIIEAKIGFKDSFLNGTPKLLLDEKGNPQSIMLYEKQLNNLYVDYLATAPWNVLKNFNDERKTKGSGTNMIIEAIKESENQGLKGKLRLSPLPSSIPFYLKLGFKYHVDKEDLYLSTSDGKKLKEKFNV